METGPGLRKRYLQDVGVLILIFLKRKKIKAEKHTRQEPVCKDITFYVSFFNYFPMKIEPGHKASSCKYQARTLRMKKSVKTKQNKRHQQNKKLKN